jgi:L,D-transpeptidase ErfK/SrfK
MADRGGRVLTTVLPGLENPLGDRWMGLKGAGIGLHGTDVPSSICRFATHGCIRLHPDDARALFERVSINTPVRIIYAPVSATLMGGHGWVEVHPDPYRRSGDLRRRPRGLPLLA